MTTVSLSWREVRLAALAGVDRHIYALSKELPDRHGLADGVSRGWDLHVIGAIGEWATAKALGLYWSDHLPGPGDIGKLEVRSTPRPNGPLIVRPRDPDAVPFVLVAGSPPVLRVVGWLAGAEAKVERWWRGDSERPGAYFVPQSALRPLDELVEVRS